MSVFKQLQANLARHTAEAAKAQRELDEVQAVLEEKSAEEIIKWVLMKHPLGYGHSANSIYEALHEFLTAAGYKIVKKIDD